MQCVDLKHLRDPKKLNVHFYLNFICVVVTELPTVGVYLQRGKNTYRDSAGPK